MSFGTAAALAIAILSGSACRAGSSVHEGETALPRSPDEPACVANMNASDRARLDALVAELRGEGIQEANTLRAMASVPRHEFVPVELAEQAYEDRPLPIGLGQTISQPYVVAFMTELLQVEPGMRVLEVGTGSGYQAAILAELAANVYSIEILPELSKNAAAALSRCGYDRVSLRVGDGYAGWEEFAPFDRILVAAVDDAVPPPLVAQLTRGGRLVMPVEDRATGEQWIRVLEKSADGSLSERRTVPVRFVPLTGKAERD
jgi:protein-L-isoaspartate(D-aspartate) O-methyltransferase